MQAKRESEPQAKAAKIDGESEKEQSDDLALMSLDGFHNVKILRQDVHHKTMFVQANIDERPGDAVVIVEKTAFTEENVKKLLSSSTKLKFKMSNDIYRQYDAYPPSLLNSLQTTVIYPASDELLAKLGSQESFMVEETPRLYETITKKFIEQKTEDMQWVYNILDHKAETERTVFDDPDPETGFVLISDLKWDGKTVDSLYLLGICYARGIRCLRDLSTQHLPLLKNMLAKGRLWPGQLNFLCLDIWI
ncbi:m7GpppX diphosphatase-like isoform X2 [Corticium candelabrum]|uniref:m7GpppX diphosphatase-like isoform X2 n=1 Tax=Corticium candelabrum TaxID=121492 RepID=UPI002E26534F|nr:m7GpppX diphosphatase-like isoform X2 [Corticium candelabrum]